MGSWTEFDAYYPPGCLTPGAAFLVALIYLEGGASLYADRERGILAAAVPRDRMALDADLLARTERFLTEVPLAEFLAEARIRLNLQQRRCLLINLLDRVLAAGAHPETHSRFRTLMEGLGVTPEELQPYWLLLSYKYDLSVFPQ
jgi:hypothetical protein